MTVKIASKITPKVGVVLLVVRLLLLLGHTFGGMQ